jgi:ABC-2 type transport system permease protein
VVTAGRVLVTINWMLPAGLTARSIQWMHAGTPWVAIAAFAGLMAYTVGFLSILNLRLHAQYLGENLSEAPATTQQKSKKTPVSSAALAPQAAHRKIVASPRGSILSASVEACLVKEIRYLLRSGPKLYSLIMPVFMIFLFSLRSAGLHGSGLAQRGFGQDAIHSYLFSYGCAYTQLVLVALLYNSLGGDGMGAQFYFLAPVRFRDVMVAKNLMTGGILAIETILIYLVSALLTAPSPAGMTAATLAWTAFTFLLNMSIGNVRSLVAPKGFEVGKVRRQNVSGLNSFISLGVVLVSIALGVITVFVCRSLQQGYWLAAGVFLIFACMAFGLYWMTLQSLDRIAGDHRESLAQELCKS